MTKLTANKNLTEQEQRDTYLVILEDGRKFDVPAAIYQHIRDSAFRHGIRWAFAHPKQEEGAAAMAASEHESLIDACESALKLLKVSEFAGRSLYAAPVTLTLAAAIAKAKGQ